MYFFKKLRHEVLLSPECFGPKLKDVIRRKLIDEVEGDRGPSTGAPPARAHSADRSALFDL